MSDPWSDPTTPTEPGSPYAGPPPTAPQAWPPAPYGAPYGPPPYGPPPGYGWPPGYAAPYPQPYPQPWPAHGWPPRGPRRPGPVVGAAVLAFVQAGIALIGTLYTYMLSALIGLDGGAGGPGMQGLAAEGVTLAIVQLLSVAPLVAGGVLVLSRRARWAWLLLLVAFAVQVLIALYWTLRLAGVIGQGFEAEGRPLVAFTLVFAAAPLVGLGLLGIGAGRRWFTEEPAG